MSSSFSTRVRKKLRRYLAYPVLQSPFRLLYRISLMGMNYGGAGSHWSSGDAVALHRLRATTRGRAVVFDVGANVGGYTEQVLETFGDEVSVYAFEPSSAAAARLEGLVSNRANVRVLREGIGAKQGSATLLFDAPGSVLASTFRQNSAQPQHREEISLTTLDAFCEQEKIERIDLLKLDLEGGELDALRGAARMLSAGAVRFIQFEFGQPSIGARTFFADIYNLLVPQFEIHRVLPQGLELIASYHETLEVFMSTNYLAVLRD